ncbi:MAG: hypothetical protein KGM43_02135 [Planctomycetota bacterium]|nr:hypothetical protein [Planctomycetota bacterium]
MPGTRKIATAVGFVIHLLIGLMLVFASYSKLAGKIPPEFMEHLAARGLSDWIKIIGVGEVVVAVLLVLPWTMPVGLLLESALWGGIILENMETGQSFAPFAVMMILSWVAAALRYPPILGAAFLPKPAPAPTA